MVRFSGGTHSFNLGDSITVNVADANLERFQNLLQVNGVLLSKANLKGTGTVTATTATVSEILADFEKYESTLVKIINCTFSGSGTFTGNKTFNDPTGSLTHYTSSSASFASETVPSSPVSLTGIVGVYGAVKQLQIRKQSDIE